MINLSTFSHYLDSQIFHDFHYPLNIQGDERVGLIFHELILPD